MFAPWVDPVSQALVALGAELDDLVDARLWALSDEQVDAVHAAGERFLARATETVLRLAAESAARGGQAKSTMVHHGGLNPAVAHRRLKVARSLAEDSHQVTREGMAAGAVSEAQAAAILDAVAALEKLVGSRSDIPADVPAEAEKVLVDHAARHTPHELTVLGKRILHVVAPEVADGVLADQLQREQDEARRRAWLSLTDNGDGSTRIRGQVPTSTATMLRRILRALMAPKSMRGTHGAGPETDESLRRPSPERWGQAFGEFVERYPVDKLPHSGGVHARVAVTIDADQLTDALKASGVAMIDDTRIPASEARRLACEAGIVPLVLDGKSKPLDVGREKRFHTSAQRLAMELRDRTCRAETCDWPAALCHGHHVTPWSRGGSTSVDDAITLCPHHHHLAHHPTWQMKRTSNGRVAFIRR